MLQVVKPVQLLYHGTVFDYSEQIEQQGLKPINYDKVYLTADINVAYDYAKQRTTDIHTNTMLPVVCIIDAQQMYKDGFVFTHEVDTAEYTVNNVPPEYILQFIINNTNDLDILAHYVHKQVD